MKLAYHIIFIACIAALVPAAYFHGAEQISRPNDFSRTIISALIVLFSVGMAGYITHFFAPKFSRIFSAMFFGFLTGIMATNFISEIVSQLQYPDHAVSVVDFGLIILLMSVSATGLILAIRQMPNQSLE